jgi:hypothetical protein
VKATYRVFVELRTGLKTVVTAEAVRAVALSSVVIARRILVASVDWEVAVEAGRHES